MGRPIQSYVFAVADEPHCIWGWDLRERNQKFIDGIDHEYFVYNASIHSQNLENDDKLRASVSLKANYHLALETFFGILGATLQAPRCAIAWLLKARPDQIRSVAKSLAEGNCTYPTSWLPNGSFSFERAAKIVFQHTNWNDSDDETAKHFSNLWRRLARDYLDQDARHEYNSIKHGFRAKAGGFHLRVGLEHEYGVPPPESEMGPWSGSVFGTSFLVAEAIGNPPVNDRNFFMREHCLNWLPDSIVGKTDLCALSIQNLRSLLAILNGSDPKEQSFHRLTESDLYMKPWEMTASPTSMSIDLLVSEDSIERRDKEALRKILNDRKTNS